MSNGRIGIVREREVYENPVRREAEAFHAEGYDVDVITMADGSSPLYEVIDGIRIHRLPVTKRRDSSLGYMREYMSFTAAAAWKLTRLHRKQAFDLIQVNTMPDFLVLCTVIPKLLGAKISVFMKEPTPELGFTLSGSRKVEALFRRFERFALGYADTAFTVTDDLRQTYIDRGADPANVHVVLNCPDVRHVTGSIEDPLDVPHKKRDRFTVICHGTIEERYGHDILVKAIDRLRTDVPDVELRITGKGGFLDELKQMIVDRGLTHHVTYLGWISEEELVAEIRAAHVGVVAQKASPYSHLVHTNKMFDYIMLGVPCVASRLNATAASFPEDALLYYNSEDPDDLAKTLLRLYEDPALGLEQTYNARQLYEDGYRWEAQRRTLIEKSLILLGPEFQSAGNRASMLSRT